MSALVSMLIQIIMNRSNMVKILEALFFFFTQLTLVSKLINLKLYSRNLLELERLLTDAIFYNHEFDQLTIIKEKIQFCNINGKIFRMMCFFTCIFFLLVPYFDNSRKNELPLPAYFPGDTEKYFVQLVVAEAIGVGLSAYCNTSIDILTWKLMSLASANFEILKCKLKKINYAGSTTESETKLLNCIQYHLKIIE